MAVSDPTRARQMELRVARTLDRHKVARPHQVLGSLGAALALRVARLDDDHDPRFLHPGRTVLVALEDGGVTDAEALAVAAVLESVSPGLRLDEGDAGAAAALRHAGSLGEWDAEDRLERILVQDPDLQVVAVAEWLDQLRHLRHWADPGTLERAGELTRSLYLPLARRVSGKLARRLDWWLRRVHLASPGGSVDH